jgi:hypothetical protein
MTGTDCINIVLQSNVTKDLKVSGPPKRKKCGNW